MDDLLAIKNHMIIRGKMLTNDVTESLFFFFYGDSIKDNYFAAEDDGWLVIKLFNDEVSAVEII